MASADQTRMMGTGTGMMSGAATGAAVGSVVPGVGTVIGAGVGALIGGTLGFMQGDSQVQADRAAKEAAKQAREREYQMRLREINSQIQAEQSIMASVSHKSSTPTTPNNVVTPEGVSQMGGVPQQDNSNVGSLTSGTF